MTAAVVAAAHGPSALWYATRGAGATALVLLTGSLVLGIAEVRVWRPGGAPRFAVAALHRTLSLLALMFVAVHVLTVLLDPFPHIGVLTAVVPFVGSYRPLWVGLGAVAFDLLLALVITSLVRRRLGYRGWRAVHWAAYAVWPVALLHGLGAGSDPRHAWLQWLTVGCAVAVVAAVTARLAGDGTPGWARTAAAAGAVMAAIALAAWLPNGPLASDWARRAGTPPSVLAAFTGSPARSARSVPNSPPADPLYRSFSTAVSGPLTERQAADGSAVVDLQLRLAGSPDGALRIRINGDQVTGGGVLLQRSAVTLGPPSDPGHYSGRIDSLNGSRLGALVGGPDGHALRLRIDVTLGPGSASGRLTATPVGVGNGA